MPDEPKYTHSQMEIARLNRQDELSERVTKTETLLNAVAKNQEVFQRELMEMKDTLGGKIDDVREGIRNDMQIQSRDTRPNVRGWVQTAIGLASVVLVIGQAVMWLTVVPLQSSIHDLDVEKNETESKLEKEDTILRNRIADVSRDISFHQGEQAAQFKMMETWRKYQTNYIDSHRNKIIELSERVSNVEAHSDNQYKWLDDMDTGGARKWITPRKDTTK